MNNDQLQGKWHQMKGEVKAQWGRLTKDDLEQVNGSIEKLVGVLQERYGYMHERAQKELDAFLEQQAKTAANPPSLDLKP